MKLYNFLYPSTDICNEKEMYFRGRSFLLENERIILDEGGYIESSTYFNSISLDKWYGNTEVTDISIAVSLMGEFDITLYICDKIDGIIKYVIEDAVSVSFKNEEKTILKFKSKKGIGFVRIVAKSQDSVFYGAAYHANMQEELKNDVRLAIGICTYKREEYVLNNLSRLNETMSDVNSPMYNRTSVYVSDNGQTLQLNNNRLISVFHNENLGGAGGFTRCLIEAKMSKEPYTHFVFMDDDIILDTHAIEKLIALLTTLKKDKHGYAIGGAMFSTDDKYLQFESASKWQDVGFVFNRRNVDMRIIENLIDNEKEYDVNYNAWCFCCIPFDVVKDNNLPLPVFFHMDDVEYGLRNAFPIITMNGINVWHLYKKGLIVAKNDYYDVRNKLIMLSEINPPAAIKLAWNYFSSFTNEVLKYHYARAINTFDGILDFAKGFDYFKNLDTQRRHGTLFNNVSWKDTSNEIIDKAWFSQNDEKTKKAKIDVLLKSIFHGNKTAYIFNDNSMKDAAGKKYVYVVNKGERKHIVYKYNFVLALVCFVKRAKALHFLKNKLPSVINEYNERIGEVQSLSFWNKYLKIKNSDNPKAKILFVASDNDATSGAFRSMVKLCSLLKECYNLNVSVLLPRKGDGIKLLKEAGIPFTIIQTEDWVVKLSDGTQRRKEKQKLMRHNVYALKKIRNYIRQEKFDLIHINTTYHYVAAKAALLLHIPFVWHLREFLEEDQQREIINKSKGYELIKKANTVITISNSLFKKYVSLLGNKNITRIYNGIDKDMFYCPEHRIFKDDVVRFICVGAITEYKGQKQLVEACCKLKEKCKQQFKLLLVGNDGGEYAKDIRAYISENGLNDCIEILGRRDDTSELFKNSDIAFVCSRSEAFGRVTVEAMMSGCLVIGANNAGTSELINNGEDGILYEVDNSEDLCSKIQWALDNKDSSQQIAVNGTKKSSQLFTAQRNAEEIYGVYSSILEEIK